MEQDMITQTELMEKLELSYPTFRKILQLTGIKPQIDSYDKRIRRYTDEQVAQMAVLASRVRRKTKK